MKDCVIICSNLVHIICAQASIKSLALKENVKLNVIIINPYLEKKEIIRIINYSKNNKIHRCLDLSHLFKFYISSDNYKLSKRNIVHKIIYNKIYFKIHNIILQIKIFNKIKYILNENKLLNIEYLFTRTHQRVYESMLIHSFNHINNKFSVEDGVGDYLEKNFFWSKFVYYEIKNKFKLFFLNFFNFMTALLLTFSIKKSLILGSYKIIKFNKVFRNVKTDKSKFKYLDDKDLIYINNEFKNIIYKLNYDFEFNYKVIIFDTILDDKLKIDLKIIPLFYNKIINSLLKDNDKLKKNQILLKHHPRINYEYWKLLKDNIECDVMEYESELSEVPGEFLINYKSVKAVYSVGSTALFYAKLLFNKNSYFIQFDNKNFHPSAFKTYEYLFKKYNFNFLDFRKFMNM